MIFITAKFQVLPEHADRWLEISRPFTEATRAEAGCLWFEWSRSVDDPSEYVLVEAFRAHFKAAQQELPPYLAATPRVVNVETPQDDWSELGEMRVG